MLSFKGFVIRAKKGLLKPVEISKWVNSSLQFYGVMAPVDVDGRLSGLQMQAHLGLVTGLG